MSRSDSRRIRVAFRPFSLDCTNSVRSGCGRASSMNCTLYRDADLRGHVQLRWLIEKSALSTLQQSPDY